MADKVLVPAVTSEGKPATIEIDGIQVDANQVYFTWKCACGAKEVQHSYTALAEVGVPICEECDCEMSLKPESFELIFHKSVKKS